jgi:ribosomal protein S3
VKGFKVKLKGKISVAGNSRKRSILYRVGKTSHSTIDVRVIHNLSLVNTFTGVMGLQTWLFY